MSERKPTAAHKLGEYPTSSRNSFASAARELEDNIYEHPSGKIRFLVYPKNPKSEGVLEELIAKKLILGKRVDDYQGRNTFVLPRSARPILHEAANTSEGAFTYTDEELFFDLGVCLGTVASTSEDSSKWRIIVAPQDTILGELIAVQEFTKSDEPRIGLVPGVESCVTEVDKKLFPDPIGAYGMHLLDLFGSRFQDAAVYFRMGFNETLEGL